MLICFVCTLSSRIATSLYTILVRVELDKLMTACWYVQQRALATGEQQSLVLHPEDASYSVGSITEKLPTGVQFGSPKQLLGSPGSPTSIIKKPITFSSNTIIAYPTGVLSAGSMYITTNNAETYALTSGVGAVSYLRMYQFNKNEWKRIDE